MPSATTIGTGLVRARNSSSSSGRRTVIILIAVAHATAIGQVGQLLKTGADDHARDGQNTLGSAPDCDIVIRDATISGRHASIRHKDEKFILTDLDSTNGTFLNDGAESIAREDLKDNDKVRVGEVVLRFKCL